MLEWGSLYVVATPIGNLEDITIRALNTLRQVQGIVAEDTRRTLKLLRHYEIEKSVVSLHEHNEDIQSAPLLQRLQRGESLALVSDAGTPLISDPGYHLCRVALSAGVRVIPIPGPSSLTAALSLGGVPPDRFVFEGFLPARSTGRRNRLEFVATEGRTLCFFEAPHRLLDFLKDALLILGDREAMVIKEISKVHEQYRWSVLSEQLAYWTAHESSVQGEFCVLVHGAPEDLRRQAEQGQALDPALEKLLRLLVKEMPVKKACKLLAEWSGFRKNTLYEYALKRSE